MQGVGIKLMRRAPKGWLERPGAVTKVLRRKGERERASERQREEGREGERERGTERERGAAAD